VEPYLPNMKKLLLLLLLTVPLQAQDTVRVRHGNYESVFSVGNRYPILVEWWVTKAKLECANPTKRQDRFLPDPFLRRESNLDNDYRGSGFDRGHLSPAADARCNARHMEESFYFTNMAPQTAGLNRGQWKNLEEWTRYLATQNDSVFVRAGCVGESRRIHRVAVPTHCWKIIVVKRTNETTAYVFPNAIERSESFEMHMVSLDSINKLTGFRFNR
jgi:endonuclease G